MKGNKFPKLDLSVIDKNMSATTTIVRAGLDFYDVDKEPFRIYGVYRDGDKYVRLPEEVAYSANDGIGSLHANTAGGRIRFATNSRRFALLIRRGANMPSDNGAYLNRASFDIYVDGVYFCTSRPGISYPVTEYEFLSDEIIEGEGEHLITVYFPNYGEVYSLIIGLDEGSTLRSAPDYTVEKPIVYYGSSITQGGCASRPALSYTNRLERLLDADCVNLGFSGSAHGEKVIAEHICTLNKSVFVMDYDFNARSIEELDETHEPFFRAVREKEPDLPIIMLSMPRDRLRDRHARRREIILRTYENAKAAGDKNVYFVDGAALFGEFGGEAFCDGVHPNDIGMYCMAEALFPLLKRILGR
ncbi:MAG: hypothetical protein IJY69_01260 [Clostridia bacterium]|nr:hypothetical protein [Clostridia bacterium]